MDEYESLSHTKWECKYHVMFIPKCRRKTLYAQLRPHLGEVFKRLAEQKESRIEEGHLMLHQWPAPSGPRACIWSRVVINSTSIGGLAAEWNA